MGGSNLACETQGWRHSSEKNEIAHFFELISLVCPRGSWGHCILSNPTRYTSPGGNFAHFGLTFGFRPFTFGKAACSLRRK